MSCMFTINTIKYMIKLDIIAEYKNNDQLDLIDKLCDEFLKNIKFNMEYDAFEKQRIYYNRSIYDKKKNMCNARIWNDHRGGRCSNSIKLNESTEYEIEKCLCQRHTKKIKKNKGELYFGLYTDPYPDTPIWNQDKSCPLGKKLNWYIM